MINVIVERRVFRCPQPIRLETAAARTAPPPRRTITSHRGPFVVLRPRPPP